MFWSDNLLKTICFLICCDKWLSFISPSLHPRTAGMWCSIRSSPRLVLWFHCERRHSRLLCAHLAVRQHLLRKQQRWQHTQGTTGITGNQITARVFGLLCEETLCPPTLSLCRAVRQALTHQDVEVENKAW